MIQFRDVVVRYPSAKIRAVDGVSFETRSGSITGVVGPNGSGKSTLVRALLGLVQIESGDIAVDGISIRELQQSELARSVAVVPQREDAVFPLDVASYVSLGRYPRLGLWRSESNDDKTAVSEAMRKASVDEFAHRNTDQLSGGEWQRVRIARALAQESKTIVLDEPTTFLDIAHEMELFELLDGLAREGLSVLLVSHELNLVARFASHIVLLKEGRVAAAGTPGEVMQQGILERVFEWPLKVWNNPELGHPALFPLRQNQSTQTQP